MADELWKKSSWSTGANNCVEVRWKKSSRSAGQTNCVELALDQIRDSKNHGVTLAVPRTAVTELLASLKR
ncbi:hypothetical protein ALI144C_48065 [Actinosynnema sp. ALI-1.44]|uniref:DUF397 domain-containing protein n=1 Tax=Actinosynnema sp. ALI-1.44 TaxID=1933779 RepID=UPI00097BDCE0|nr:DUF397 domain-containing protein [Actinosynnema sp. ALI-1.44]ONI70420.1 hypothetical protein ALI144C_48065 [Actinosynnema sp. ALI-1.44]